VSAGASSGEAVEGEAGADAAGGSGMTTGVGVGIGVGAGAGADAGNAAGRGAGENTDARWEAATALVQLAGAAERAGGPPRPVPGPNPMSNARWLATVGLRYKEGRVGQGGGGRVERPDSGLQGAGDGAHRSNEATVEEKLRQRRARLREAAREEESSAQPPAQGAGGGSDCECSLGPGARGGGGAGRKRKAPAAGALEAVRAEKVRREVQWAHVRAAMCGVLLRTERKRAGKKRAREKRTGHSPGTAAIVRRVAAPSQVMTVTVQEGKLEKRSTRKCQEVPPGTYAPVKRAKGTPPDVDPPPM